MSLTLSTAALSTVLVASGAGVGYNHSSSRGSRVSSRVTGVSVAPKAKGACRVSASGRGFFIHNERMYDTIIPLEGPSRGAVIVVY